MIMIKSTYSNSSLKYSPYLGTLTGILRITVIVRCFVVTLCFPQDADVCLKEPHQNFTTHYNDWLLYPKKRKYIADMNILSITYALRAWLSPITTRFKLVLPI